MEKQKTTIMVMSKEAIKHLINMNTFAYDKECYIISIQDPDRFEFYNYDKDRILYLKFHDIDSEYYKNYQLMTDNDAKQIVNFVQKNININKVRLLIVHCTAGLSRSPAVAAAILKFLGEDNSKYLNENGKYCINKYCYNKTLEWFKKMTLEENNKS